MLFVCITLDILSKGIGFNSFNSYNCSNFLLLISWKLYSRSLRS